MEPTLVTKLFAAVDEGDLDAVKTFLSEKDVTPNFCNETGMTLLMQAAYKGETEICEHLLNCGARVNEIEADNQYTALMMGALAGKISTVDLLLKHGADVDKTNSIGKTAVELAGFVGQHECANLMKNFLSLDKLRPYTTSQGGNDPRLPESAASDVQKLIMLSNPHPVKIMFCVMDSEVLRDAAVLKKVDAVMHDLLGKCVRSRSDFDEVLAMKLHYFSSILSLCYEFMKKNEKTSFEPLIKKMLHVDGDGFQVAVETIIRKSILSFPFTDLPLMQQFVTTIHPVMIGSNPTSLSCLFTMFNGMQATSLRHNVCEACAADASPLRCSACKQASYCSKRCQKLHWFVHKKFCKKIKS